VKETKKVREKSVSKGKGKGNVSKTNRPRKELDTIVGPQNKHTLWIRVAHGLPP